MKIQELLEEDSKGEAKYSRYGHSRYYNQLNNYYYDDCVVAYYKERFSCIFIIKGKIKYFAFVSLRTNFWNGFDMKGLYPKEALELMGDNLVIVDKELFGKLKKTMMMEALG